MELVNTGRRVQNPLQHKGFRRFQSCRHRPQQTRKCQVRTRLEISAEAGNFVPLILLDIPQHRKSQNRIFFAVSPVFSQTNFRAIFWKKARMKIDTESCPSGRRCSTRNAVDRKVSRVRIPNSPPKTQSYQGFRPYDWAFLFSQGHIGVHDFRQELKYASRSALCPAESGYCPLHLPR